MNVMLKRSHKFRITGHPHQKNDREEEDNKKDNAENQPDNGQCLPAVPLRMFTDLVDSYPYPELDILPALLGFGYGGMEFPGLIMVNSTSFFDTPYSDAIALSDGVAHEIGHQWFYAVVGNNEYREGWIDEGFTSWLEEAVFNETPCAANTYLRKIDSMAIPISRIVQENKDLLAMAREDYAGIRINTPPYRYSGDQFYGQAEYEEAQMFLREVCQKMGMRKFRRFLRKYYRNYQWKVVTTKDVLALIRSFDNSKKMNEIIHFYTG
jgi:aminopeptidase N